MPIIEEEDDTLPARPPALSRPHRESTTRILHSSMSPFTLATQDQEFPSFPRALGVITRLEKSSARRPTETILIEQEWPTLTSVIRGEESARDSAELTTRARIRELITRCRELRDELDSHATRLERIVARNPPLVHFGEDEISTQQNTSPAPHPDTYSPRRVQSSHTATSSPKPPKQAKSKSLSTASGGLTNLLNLLDEDDD